MAGNLQLESFWLAEEIEQLKMYKAFVIFYIIATREAKRMGQKIRIILWMFKANPILFLKAKS